MTIILRILFNILIVCQIFIPAASSKDGVRCGRVSVKDRPTHSERNPNSEYLCVDCLFPANCLVNDTCKQGTTGSMCEKCASNTDGSLNYYRQGSVCIQCPMVPWTAVCFCVYIVIFIGCCLYYGFTVSLCTKVKLLIHYLQLLVLTTHLKIAWPDLLLQCVSTLNFGVFNSNMILPGCIFPKLKSMTVHYLEWYSSVCIPVLILIIGLMLDRSFKVLIGNQDGLKEEVSERRVRKIDRRLKCRRFVCMGIFVMYMPALLSCMRTLQCSRTIMKDLVLDRPGDVFLLDTEQSCRTFMFQVIHSLAVLYLIAIILITFLVLFFTIRQKKWKLLDKDWPLYSPFYESYKNKYCFWESVVMLRKLLCVMVTESHPIKPRWQVGIQLGLTVIYIVLLIVLRPYRSCFWAHPRLNNHLLFEILSNVSVFLLQGIGFSIITGHFSEQYCYIVIVSVGVVLMVWLILMATMKCETETHLMEILSNVSVFLLQGIGLSIITGHFSEQYCYIVIVSVGVVLMVWLILMATMKCETETHLMEFQRENEEAATEKDKAKVSSCLKFWKRNRVEPDPHFHAKVEERKQNINF